MLKALLLALLLPTLTVPATTALQSGTLLRFHVIAADDTPQAQAIKAPIRDAVRSAYARLAPEGVSMLEAADSLLPVLTQAATEAAQRAGYSGTVTVSLEEASFDTRVLDGIVIPEGRYPALIIRMGEAQGHNWWGLLDPETSLIAACAGDAETLTWDWSLRALVEALLGYCPTWLEE